MNLLDIVNRTAEPIPWEEGDNIPWDDPAFSKRMLAEHLTQAHDLASRRFEKIDQHVAWIHNEVLGGNPTRILDLACGPGLYSTRLARLGHECVGIDYSPASIAYAQEQAAKEHLSCTFIHDDIRAADFGMGYGLVMLIYGEFNVFSTLDARAIVRKVSQALACDGRFLIEPHTYVTVQKVGQAGRSWYSSKSGLFSEKPHLCMMENSWSEDTHTATIRYYILDAAGRQVTPYAQTLQAYTIAEYQTMLAERGLEEVECFPSLTGAKDPAKSELFAIVAREGTDEA